MNGLVKYINKKYGLSMNEDELDAMTEDLIGYSLADEYVYENLNLPSCYDVMFSKKDAKYMVRIGRGIYDILSDDEAFLDTVLAPALKEAGTASILSFLSRKLGTTVTMDEVTRALRELFHEEEAVNEEPAEEEDYSYEDEPEYEDVTTGDIFIFKK